MRSKKFWLSATVTSLITAGILSYPTILRWQVEKRIPKGVTFSDVSLGTSGVTLKNVNIQKDWISGHLDTITSDFDGKNITVTGGELTANIDSRHKTPDNHTNTPQRNITASNLSVTALFKGHKINLENVHTSGHKICFSTAKLSDPHVTTSSGCYDKESNTVTVETISAKHIEFHGTGISDLTAKNITYDTKAHTARLDTSSAQITFKNQTFTVSTSGTTASKQTGSVSMESLKVKHGWLSSDWITMKNVKVTTQPNLQLSVENSITHVDPENLTISGSENCSTWVNSLPQEIKVPPLDTVKLSGTTNFSIGFHPKPSFTLKSDCKATCSSLPNLRKPFTYSTYTPDGKKFQRETGPGSKEWIPLDSTGDMSLAVTNMEDPGFQHHHGYITQAFFNSFIDNIKHDRFLRGGSTITMQLVKNIWLNREKTLGRKVQEFFLAQALESCYSKDEIMELYLNVVEFGPNRYGVGHGAHHWFKKGPGELSPVESFWLASILPRPSRTGPPTEQSLKKIKSLIKQLATNDRIPADMLDYLEEEAQQESEPQEPTTPGQ
jgi:hypothetical protein